MPMTVCRKCGASASIVHKSTYARKCIVTLQCSRCTNLWHISVPKGVDVNKYLYQDLPTVTAESPTEESYPMTSFAIAYRKAQEKKQKG